MEVFNPWEGCGFWGFYRRHVFKADEDGFVLSMQKQDVFTIISELTAT